MLKKFIIDWINVFLTILFFVSGILIVFEIHIFRLTLINWIIPTSIFILTGLILTPLTSNLLKIHFNTKNYFLRLIYNIVTAGGLLISTLMISNYYLSYNSETTIKTKILKTGHLAKGRYGCGNPYCDIVLKNEEKQLIFPCDFEIENYDTVVVIVKKGLFGFDIITDKKAI